MINLFFTNIDEITRSRGRLHADTVHTTKALPIAYMYSFFLFFFFLSNLSEAAHF